MQKGISQIGPTSLMCLLRAIFVVLPHELLLSGLEGPKEEEPLTLLSGRGFRRLKRCDSYFLLTEPLHQTHALWAIYDNTGPLYEKMVDGCGHPDFIVRYQAFQAVEGWVCKVTEAVRSLGISDGVSQCSAIAEKIDSILRRTIPQVVQLVVWNWEHTQRKGLSYGCCREHGQHRQLTHIISVQSPPLFPWCSPLLSSSTKP